MTFGTSQSETLLAGLIGRGIGLSRTPAMHMAEAEAQGLSSLYRLLDMDAPERSQLGLAGILSACEACGFDGLNVTYPYKIDVIELLDTLSDNARAVGAVNTVVLSQGRRIGHNTDLWGFAESFRRGLEGSATDHALLLGAGGAGVAVAHALADCGIARLTIVDSDRGRAERLAEQVSRNRPGVTAQATDDPGAGIRRDPPDGIVNATPMGMAKLPGMAIDAALIEPAMWVADIVYFPLETELLRVARAKGCRVLPGSGMAVFQAVRAFELFTGRAAESERMAATFEALGAEPAPHPAGR
ncbi:shikimate dehydrogenase [Roseivivax halodurans]|uniref:shikimate dehydrogenase n=1 Tax=Roseivivax halodurans TaxID=93683 RepID=UPI0004B0043B|nr:shikimate dehydrogenase [Roseivivax halodurans]